MKRRGCCVLNLEGKKHKCIAVWHNCVVFLSLQCRKSFMDNEKVKKGQYVLAAKLKVLDYKTEPLFGLDKIPVEALYKAALEQIGEQESYIAELEAQTKQFEAEKKQIRNEVKVSVMREIQKKAVLEAKKQQYTDSLLRKISKQDKKIKALYESRNYLLNELAKQHIQIDSQKIIDTDEDAE